MAKRKIDLYWGQGESNLFLVKTGKKYGFLDYEFDYYQIHKLAGGRNYYRSRSGNSGAGYIWKYKNLIPVGFYRVDTTYNNFQKPIEIAEGVQIMMPYVTHVCDKHELFREYPVVILVGDTIIYSDYYTNMDKIVTMAMQGNIQSWIKYQKVRIFERTFANKEGERKVKLNFINLFKYPDKENYSSPWEFAGQLLGEFLVRTSEERLYQIFRISNQEDWFARYSRVVTTPYATQAFKEDPLELLDSKEKVESYFQDWNFAETNMLYKVKKGEIYLVGWTLAKPAFEKQIERISGFIPEPEREAFLTFMKKNEMKTKYVEYEVCYISDVMFPKYKETYYEMIRKGIEKKVKEHVQTQTKMFLQKINDKKILEEISDDLVIVFEDSLAAGNCRPGTQAFAEKHFPGQTQITAGELKKFSDNSNVMRIFRYIAERDGFIGKEKLEIPA